eukprot:g4873.t1
MEPVGHKLDLSFSHFGIFARDPKSLGSFYVRYLGFTVTDTGTLPSGDLVFLSRDPTEHHQIVLCSGRPEGGFNTVNQISLRTTSLDALRELAASLGSEPSVSEILPVTHGNAISLYFRDPEGNRCEVFIDAPFYCQQPQRVAVDLSKSDTEIWSFVEEHARSQPNFKSRDEWMRGIREKMARPSPL